MARSSTSESITTPIDDEKHAAGIQVEKVPSNEIVPGHPGYYEKDGLRTYGDDEDHDHEPPVLIVWQCGLNHVTNVNLSVVLEPDHVIDCHGVLMDRLSNSSIHLRCYPPVHLSRDWRRGQMGLVCQSCALDVDMIVSLIRMLMPHRFLPICSRWRRSAHL